MQEEKNVSSQEVCEQFLHELSQANVDGIIAWFDQQATITFPYAGPEPKVITGKEAYGEFLRKAFRVMKDLKFEQVNITTGQETYWIQTNATGMVLAGEEEKPYHQHYVMKLHLHKGRIDNYTEYSNPLPLLAILGEEGIQENFQ